MPEIDLDAHNRRLDDHVITLAVHDRALRLLIRRAWAGDREGFQAVIREAEKDLQSAEAAPDSADKTRVLVELRRLLGLLTNTLFEGP
jgi:hypothetical protein